jgi:hypothetical protein
MSNDNEMADVIKSSLAKVLPGAMVTFLGIMLMLALGVGIVVYLPVVIKPLVAGMTQPFRSIVLFLSLAVPLVVLASAGRRVMGYIISRTTST